MKENTKSLINLRILGDKEISKFIVLSTNENEDWLMDSKLSNVFEKLEVLKEGENLDLKVKSTVKGNADEGKEQKIGKALKLTLVGQSFTVDVYTQKPDEKWVLSHTHNILRDLLIAYTRTIHNDSIVELELKKLKNKIDENFKISA
jgi:hypothetical protein